MNSTTRTLLLCSSFFVFANTLMLPVYAVFVEQIGGDVLTAGTTYGAFSITLGFLMYFISRWEDSRKHLEQFIVIGYAINAAGFLLYAFVEAPIQLFAVQVVLGISMAIRLPAYDATYTKSLDPEHLVFGWGSWTAVYFVVAGVAALAGGAIAQFLGFRVLLWTMFVLSIFAFIASLRLLSHS